MTYEHHNRSILKAVTNRTGSLFVTFVVLAAFGVPFGDATLYTLTINGIKMAFYFVHERVWSKQNWGYKLNAN